MSKKMTPLQALKKVKKARYFVDFELDAKVGEDYKEELSIIETALKECGLLKRSLNRNWVEVVNDDKKLKALKIIKREPVMVICQFYKCAIEFNMSCYRQYCKFFSKNERSIKSKEEYDLLKEVLQ